MKRNRRWTLFCLLLFSSFAFGLTSLTQGQVRKALPTKPAIDPTLFQAMEYRLVGPFRGGRAPAVSGIPGDLFTFYMGTSGGGVWKTTDAGTTWINISDGFFKSGSIGAIAIAPSDPTVIYVGTGEANIRGDVQTGVGVYKSEDAGKTWKNVGLENCGQIGRIRIHPKNPDLVFVAVLGHAFGPNPERGVYRSKDGGKSWDKVLFVSDKAGAVDLSMNPQDPRVLYAAIYQVLRQPWILVSGGEQSGLYKSVDGGDSWTKLTSGLPKGVKGRIGVTVSPANPSRVWAIIEAEDGGIFFSEDEGESFARVNKDRVLRTRSFYFSHIYADPVEENTVYVMGIDFHRSRDNGKTFEMIDLPHGDTHDMWVNPQNPKIMINGNDGGGTISFNGGKTWSTQMNQPTAEFYRLATDNQFFYRLYGAQQDNSTASIASRTSGDGISIQDWYEVGGGEQGHIWVDPRDSNIIYAGVMYNLITRLDRSTGQTRNIEAYPEMDEGQATEAMKYRFQDNAPIRISPHDPRILYYCSQYVHKSLNEGQSWETISPDLTRNDKSKQKPSGGPITLDHTGPEIYDTIFAFEESPLKAGELWAGTDDGLVHVSRDGGAHWENVTPKNMPEWATVNMIELSVHSAGRAFIAVQRYRLDDFKPCIYRTDDYGKTWELISADNGIPARHFVRVVREDPVRRGLLYAGTEFGMYVSFDDGKSWQSFQLNLPIVQISDMAIKENDLALATHGRSFWILDDITPLRQITDEVARGKYFLYQPRAAYRTVGGSSRDAQFGKNPPPGAVIYFQLAEVPKEEVLLEVLDSEGKIVRTFSSKDGALGPLRPGMNRFIWNLSYPPAETVQGAFFAARSIGPKAVPGSYQVRLKIGSWNQTQTFEVKKDPRLSTTAEDFKAQFDLAVQVRDKFAELEQAVRDIRDVRDQVDHLLARLEGKGQGDEITVSGKSLKDKLRAIEEKLMQTKNETQLDTCNFPPMLDSQFLLLLNLVLSSDTKPTDGLLKRFEDIKGEWASYRKELDKVFDQELAQFNDLVRSKNVPAILVLKKKVS